MSAILLRLLYYLAVAFVVGTVSQLVTGYRKQRIFTTFLLGFIGVVIADQMALHFHFPYIFGFFGISLVWSTLGAILFILLFKLIRGRW